MSDSGFVPPREWHWSAWLLLSSAALFGLVLGYWFSRVQYRLKIEDVQRQIAEEQQMEQLGGQIGSVNDDLELRQSFQQSYRELQAEDIEQLAEEKFEEQKLEYEAQRKTQIQLLQSEAHDAYVQGKWSDSENGAVLLYRNILRMEPNNVEALERMDAMAQRFSERSVEFEEKENLSSAMEFALNSLDVKSTPESVARVHEVAEKIALAQLTGQAVQGGAKDALDYAESKFAEIGPSNVIEEGVDAINEYRDELGIQYTPEWAGVSAKEIRSRGLEIIDDNPTSSLGYELLQYASAIDGQYVSVPQINIPQVAAEAAPAPVVSNNSENVATQNNSQTNVWASGYNHYISGAYGLARADFEQAVNLNNDPRAQFYLALMYGEGEGVQQNTVRSQQYLSQIAPTIRTSLDRNETWAQVAQGVMYEKGWMLQQNPEQALNSYTQAALAGDIEAQYRLGKLLETVGGTRANRNAAEWLALAKVNGHSGD